MKKKLIINPKKKEITPDMKGLAFDEVFGTLFLKVYQQENSDRFSPMVTKEGHIRRFISNVEPMRVAIQDFAGKSLSSAEEAEGYLHTIGQDVYGDKQWAYRLIVNEVKYGRENVFYMETTSDSLVKKLKDALEDVAEIDYKKVKNKKNDTPELDTESGEASTESQINGKENVNE